MNPRLCPITCILVLAFAASLDAAQRQYSVGSGVNLSSAAFRNPSGSIRTFYTLFPSVTMTSSGATSTLGMSYRLSFRKGRGGSALRPDSHNATLNFSVPLGPRWTLNLADAFRKTSDTASFNGFQGITTSPDDFGFLFDPTGARRSARTNNATFGLAHSISSTSTLSVLASHNLRWYQSSLAGLSNQQRVQLGLTFTHQTSTRASWSAGYTAAYSTFQSYADVGSQAATLAWGYQLSRSLAMQITGGSTYSRSFGASGSGYLGYSGSAQLRTTLDTLALVVHYTRRVGSQSGVGSVSDTERAGVSLSFPVASSVTPFLDASVFRGRGRLGNPYGTEGASVVASLGFRLFGDLSLHGGGQFLKYTQPAQYAFTQTRVFLNLRYDAPDLWAFVR